MAEVLTDKTAKLEAQLAKAQRKIEILERMVEDRTRLLYKKNEDLERQLREENEQLLSSASHDLHEPLTTISGYAQLLLDDKTRLDGASQKFIQIILKSSDRMKNLVKDLVHYSKIGKGQVIEDADCDKLISEVLSDLNASIRSSNAAIHSHSLPVVKGYPLELKLLFQNLISNAIKFRKKDVAPVIELSAVDKDDYWLFSCKDNGIGIEQKNFEKIFIIFKRLHNRNEYEGAGIGLANCKKKVELHGGRIWIDSALGQGSTLYFTINKNL